MNKNEQLKEIANIILESDKITFFTGAGISVPSGIPDFRSPTGLWAKYDPMEYCSMVGFKKNPDKVWAFLTDLYEKYKDYTPNQAHYAIKKIQDIKGSNNVIVITQNIDTLHTKAGTESVYEIHGSPEIVHCVECSFEEPLNEHYLKMKSCPRCPNCNALMKLKIIIFGEQLDLTVFSQAMNHSRSSEIVIGVGTSLEVIPAANIFLSAPPYTKKVLFNLEPTFYGKKLDYFVRGDVIETLPELVSIIKEMV